MITSHSSQVQSLLSPENEVFGVTSSVSISDGTSKMTHQDDRMEKLVYL
jgi:hypothetical protein